ncbi:MAG: hypothetical protein KAY65_10795 [Planctomycetes bacterium]|nr:hypothetical protein [Planctomycetota bacterium]
MKDAEGNEVEEVQGGERRGRRGKWRIVLFAALVVAVIAAVFCFRGQGVGEQLRALAAEDPPNDGAHGLGGFYQENPLGPRWYVNLAQKYKLPLLKRPFAFCSRAVTDEDMPVVARANTLRMLGLRDSEISDAGMAHLEGLTKLQGLGLSNTDIGDAGLAHLSELTKLRELYLDGTKVSDAGLAHLKKFKNLQSLDLSGTEVTDAGLAHLKSLKGLAHLEILRTRVTSDGVADLKSAIPKANVFFK